MSFSFNGDGRRPFTRLCSAGAARLLVVLNSCLLGCSLFTSGLEESPLYDDSACVLTLILLARPACVPFLFSSCRRRPVGCALFSGCRTLGL